jgi:YcxB-like protein
VAVTSVFEFDSSEYYRALRVVSRHTAARWVSWGFAALALVLAVLAIRDGWWRTSPVALFLNALPWVLLGVFWVVFLPVSQRWAARRLPKRDASVRGPQERTVDADGFHSRGNGVALDVPWHAMLRGVESDEFFLFFYSKQLAYYLPKRVLSSTQIGEVRAMMRSGLGGRARLFSD